MNMDFFDLVSWIMLAGGSFFLVVGSIGLVRMPDVFTRMHATSVAETMGVGLVLGGLMVQAGLTLVTVKLVALFLLIFLTGPVASHAIARAALADGVEPILDGPEIDARKGEKKRPLGGTHKTTTPIDAMDVERAASVFAEDEDDQPEGRK